MPNFDGRNSIHTSQHKQLLNVGTFASNQLIVVVTIVGNNKNFIEF